MCLRYRVHVYIIVVYLLRRVAAITASSGDDGAPWSHASYICRYHLLRKQSDILRFIIYWWTIAAILPSNATIAILRYKDNVT